MYRTQSFFNRSIISDLSGLSEYQGNGKFCKLAEAKLESITGAGKAILTPSCTAALEMAALILDVGPGDEVIVPSYTFATSASAFALRGAEIRYVDICKQDFNVTFEAIEAAISPKTKVVVYVDYAGVARDIDAISLLCKSRGIFLVEDAAQALGSTYDGKALGSFGDLSTFSFHETKNIHCGEGGALIINNKDLIDNALVVRDKGTNRESYSLGNVSKYEWVGLGSSFLISEFQAFILGHQIEFAYSEAKRRRDIYNSYFSRLASLEAAGFIRRQIISQKAETNGHIAFLILNNSISREGIIRRLYSKDIVVTSHYEPLHLSPYGKKYHCSVPLVNTEKYSERLLRLPIGLEMTEFDVNFIVEKIEETIFES